MEKEFNFSEKLKEFREKKRQEEIQRTGIEGYCICCGDTHYVGKEVEHDKECIWYERTI
jgi:hypothetical protein